MVRLKLKTNPFDWLPSRLLPKARTDGESNGVAERFSIITCLRVIQELWRPCRARIRWSKNSFPSTRQSRDPFAHIFRTGLQPMHPCSTRRTPSYPASLKEALESARKGRVADSYRTN